MTFFIITIPLMILFIALALADKWGRRQSHDLIDAIKSRGAWNHCIIQGCGHEFMIRAEDARRVSRCPFCDGGGR